MVGAPAAGACGLRAGAVGKQEFPSRNSNYYSASLNFREMHQLRDLEATSLTMGEDIDLRPYLSLVWRRRYTIGAVTLAAILAASVVTAFSFCPPSMKREPCC